VNEMLPSMSGGLRAFLEHPSRPPDTLTYHELQGFLFTIACAPELVKPSEWIPIVFGEADAGYASLAEAEAIITELMTLYNDVNAAVREGRAMLPADCEFRSHDLANLDDDAPVAQWSRGFLQGHQWLEETWDPYVPDEIDQDYAALLMTLTFFASSKLAGAYCAEIGDRTVADVAPMMRDAFPDALAQYAALGLGIQQILRETEAGEDRQPRRRVGRNEPCPCGSGKKHKRCCGM
jgi:uncharacterized protein